LTTFRRRSGDFMKQLKKSKRPVVLTVKGKAAAIVQDAEAYQRLLDVAARAVRDLEILYVEKNAAESRAAARWYNGLEQAVYALASYPRRCPVAPEARRAKRKLRHLLYGKKPHVYRVI